MKTQAIPTSLTSILSRLDIGARPRRHIWRHDDGRHRYRAGLKYDDVCRLVAAGLVANDWTGPGGPIAITAADQIVLRELVAEVARSGSASCVAGENLSVK
jgi:hypothetical protein